MKEGHHILYSPILSCHLLWLQMMDNGLDNEAPQGAQAGAKNPVDDELVTKDMVIKAESNAGYLRRLVNMGNA